ncbi:discoidin domain-containing protein [Rudaea sp.]|uniref:discoidin domain-containing protein n=1 Tax=Rudaea sp. TaxID=2136325 RepID=UPI002ED3585D
MPKSPGSKLARFLALPTACMALSLSMGVAHADTGIDFALHRPANGSPVCKASEPASNAVDGTLSSVLDKFCSLARPAWLRVDLGQVRQIREFTIRHAGAGGELRSWNTRAFEILVSRDGSHWRRVVEVVDNTADVSHHPVAPVDARYVKLVVHVPAQDRDPATRIFELEVR